MSLDQREQQYTDEVPSVLLNFQYIEEALKYYLFRCHVMTADVVRPFLYYSMRPIERLKKLPLGKLIDQFRDFSDNAGLIARLQELNPKRNLFAQSAYLRVTDRFAEREGSGDPLSELRETIEESDEVFWLLNSEVKALEARFVEFRSNQASTPSV